MAFCNSIAQLKHGGHLDEDEEDDDEDEDEDE